MASFPTQSPGLFDSNFQNDERSSKTAKIPDNPLLGRAPLVPRNESPMVFKQSTNDSTLRQRRFLKEEEPAKSGFKAPPKSSLSLGTGRNVTSIEQPQVSVE